MTVQVKNGAELFWREKNFSGQTALFPTHILRKMQNQKNSQGHWWTMGAAVFGNLVIPQAMVLLDRKWVSVVISLIGCAGLDDANDMVDVIRSVVGNGLKYIEELLFQGKEVVVVWLANDGRLGVESILQKLQDVRWGTHSFFLGVLLTKKHGDDGE